MVALRKESVDRNKDTCLSSKLMYQSLSARRAWIEIYGGKNSAGGMTSLSARRAWIEIGGTKTAVSAWIPSLSARRAWIEMPPGLAACVRCTSRSPQGERG